jgi:tetratricopeptide (TPR) repeat protein
MLSYNSLCRCFPGITAAHLILVLGLAGSSAIAFAAPQNITNEEMALLPRYCPYTQAFGNSGSPGNPSPGAKPYVAMMGEEFWAMHHYCWALINRHRAMRSNTPPQVRLSLLKEALGDSQYVIKHSRTRKDFILLPELHTVVGEIELRLKLPNDANQSFAKARALKPNYWPAYSHWAEFLIRAGYPAEAKKLVKTGLEYSPNAKLLREQYRLLGGKLSEIVPKLQESPPADAAAGTPEPPLVEETD